MSSNDYTEAGRIASLFRRSESRRDKAIRKAEADHAERCKGYLAPASPTVRKLLAVGLDVRLPEPHLTEAEIASILVCEYDGCTNRPALNDRCMAHQPDVGENTVVLPAWATEPVPPADGVVVKTRGR